MDDDGIIGMDGIGMDGGVVCRCGNLLVYRRVQLLGDSYMHLSLSLSLIMNSHPHMGWGGKGGGQDAMAHESPYLFTS